MEPPGYGRKHECIAENLGITDRVPQWSRPVMGGNTPEIRSRRVLPETPQWSRPVMGGLLVRYLWS